MNQKKAGKEASSSARGDHTAIAHRAVVRVRDSAVAAGPLDQAGGGRGGGGRAASHAAQGDWLTLAGHNGGHSIYSNDLWDPGELLPQYRRFPSQSLTLLSSLFASLPPPLHLPSLPERTDHPQICTWGLFRYATPAGPQSPSTLPGWWVVLASLPYLSSTYKPLFPLARFRVCGNKKSRRALDHPPLPLCA